MEDVPESRHFSFPDEEEGIQVRVSRRGNPTAY